MAIVIGGAGKGETLRLPPVQQAAIRAPAAHRMPALQPAPLRWLTTGWLCRKRLAAGEQCDEENSNSHIVSHRVESPFASSQPFSFWVRISQPPPRAR